MKLTKQTIPQAMNYQCDSCKSIFCHKDMVDESICYECQANIDLDLRDEKLTQKTGNLSSEEKQ